MIAALIASLAHDSVVVSGGCEGPDKWAEDAARAAGLEVTIFLPDLPPKGAPRHQFTEAYYARNRLIAENCDVLHAFVAPDRKGGTEYTIKHALKIKVPVVIWQSDHQNHPAQTGAGTAPRPTKGMP
jgi:predicted Rossmann fold nucleotide-binding protein DprA/Smf involved in DNA uptake